jgi:hypothetical protein
MKAKKSYIGILALVMLLSVSPFQAEAAGWTDNPDGHAAIVNGCLVHIHTQEYRLFGITWATREVVDIVACP